MNKYEEEMIKRKLKGNINIYIAINIKASDQENIIFIKGRDEKDALNQIKKNMWINEKGWKIIGEILEIADEVQNIDKKVIYSNEFYMI